MNICDWDAVENTQRPSSSLLISPKTRARTAPVTVRRFLVNAGFVSRRHLRYLHLTHDYKQHRLVWVRFDVHSTENLYLTQMEVELFYTMMTVELLMFLEIIEEFKNFTLFKEVSSMAKEDINVLDFIVLFS